MSDLKPCPFCGCDDVSEKINLANGLYVHCNHCGARNDENYTGDNRHVIRWNTRTEERAKTVEACLAAGRQLNDRAIVVGDDYSRGKFDGVVEYMEAIKGVGGVCEHGKGLTDYCEPCGRIHGGG